LAEEKMSRAREHFSVSEFRKGANGTVNWVANRTPSFRYD
jgi:hypothetical protein